VSDLNNDYYQHDAGMFFADTVDVDMTPLYRRSAGWRCGGRRSRGCGRAGRRRIPGTVY
jgi:hypothetical protein